MNRLLITFLLFAFLCHLDIMGQDVPCQMNEMRGDVNGDGVVNAADVVIIVNEIFGQYRGGKGLVVKKNGGGDYTSLSEAIIENMGNWGVTIFLDEGEYDLIQEMEDYYGTSDFLSHTPCGRGLELGYDITIKASPKAIIKANYMGDDERMLKYFSPFNSYMEPYVGGFSLIGVNIQCSRVRYVVHDEKGGGNSGPYNNLYENCNFYIDNTNNSSWDVSVCVGGGLGHSGCIIVKNCVFDGVYPNRRDALVSWHNNATEGDKSFIWCIGNYLKGDKGFRFSWYGDSKEVTEVLLQGNNVGRATIVGPEPGTSSPNENVHVKEYDTIVRQQD